MDRLRVLQAAGAVLLIVGGGFAIAGDDAVWPSLVAVGGVFLAVAMLLAGRADG